MIKKVRNEFIFTAMGAMTFLMILMIASINIINYRQVENNLGIVFEEMCMEDQLHKEEHVGIRKDIEGKETDGGEIEGKKALSEEGNLMGNEDMKGKRKNPHPVQRLYQSRYFVIRIPTDGEIFVTNDSISSEEAQGLAEEIQEADQTGKRLKDYKYRVYQTDMGISMYVLDCSTEYTAIRRLLWISVLIGLFGLMVIFLFIYYMSGKVVRPLEESMDKQKQFITDASHELKTPVSVISTNMEVLKMDIGQNEWVESTQRQIVKLRKLISHLISLSRMEESVTVVEKKSFSLSETIQELVEVYETMAEVEGKELISEITEDIRINAEEKSIREMLTVLLENAVKYSTDGSQIKAILKRDGKKILFSTENEWAHDVEKEDLPKVFERFYRGDKSRNRDSKNSGYGLGLSIARTAAERNKGSIDVTETSDGKILFKVYLKP